MEEVKIAKCVGVTAISLINIECPYCGHETEIRYQDFIENIGEPWIGDHEGQEVTCAECQKSFQLGEFEV